MTLLLIFVAGGLGSVFRYVLGGFVQTKAHAGFPVGTLVVNVLGCIAIGIVAKFFLHSQTQLLTRTTLIVGFCGGFTTFSTFSYDALGLIAGGMWARATMYVGITVASCLVGTALGFALTPSLSR